MGFFQRLVNSLSIYRENKGTWINRYSSRTGEQTKKRLVWTGAISKDTSKELKHGHILLNQLSKGFDTEVLKLEVLFSSHMMVNKLTVFFMFSSLNFLETSVILTTISVVHCLKIPKSALHHVNTTVQQTDGQLYVFNPVPAPDI